MTTSGKTWVTKTMLCLQRQLVPFATGIHETTCPALKSYAFGTAMSRVACVRCRRRIGRSLSRW
jgi:hypothetical protein